MILAKSQMKRLFELLDPLTVYANKRLDAVDAKTLADDLHLGLGLDPDAQGQVLSELWENRNVIDDFIRQNPAKLSAAQLNKLAIWRDAPNSLFSVWRCPDGIVRLLGLGYAFEVCGISREIEDMLSGIPTAVKATLLPFEGRIVYAEAMFEFPVNYSENMRRLMDEDAARLLSEGKALSTDMQLIQAIPVIQQKEAERAEKQLAADIEEMETPEPEKGTGWHRGLLAGMTYEEREAAIMAELQKEEMCKPQFLVGILDERCSKGAPKTRLEELLALDTKYRLVPVARMLDVPVSSSDKKAQVVQKLAAALVNKDTVNIIVRSLRKNEIHGLRSLVEHGGVMQVDATSLSTLAGLPPVLLGVCYLFRTGDLFTFVVPQELRPVLSDMNWDDALKEAERREDVRVIAECLTELRGIVRLAEFLEEYARICPDGFSRQDTLNTLAGLIEFGDVGFCSLETPDDEAYLLHYELADEYQYAQGDERVYDGSFLTGPLGSMLENLLASQRGKDPRPLESAMLAEGDIFHWKEKRAPVQALREFLDQHVPDTANDYFFADRVVEDILEEQKWGIASTGIDAYMQILEVNNIVLDERQLNRFIRLLMNAVNELPCWPNNGWAPNDLLEPGMRRAFFNEDGSRKKVGRNDPCPCGSGKKYKKCCGRPGA